MTDQPPIEPGESGLPQPHPDQPNLPQPHPDSADGGELDPNLPQPHPDDPNLPQPHPDIADYGDLDPNLPQPHPDDPNLPQPHPDIASGGLLSSLMSATTALVVAGGLALGAILGFTVFAGDDGVEGEIVEAPTAVSALDCPGGATLTEVFGGDRVYAIGQDETGEWRAIRNPRDTRQLVWVPASTLDQDSEADLPVVECPAEGTITIAVSEETTTTTTEAGEDTTTTTAGQDTTTTSTTTTTTIPGDTEPPQWGGVPYVENGVIWGEAAGGSCEVTSDFLFGVSDNVAVVSMTGSYGQGLPGSPLVFQPEGGNVWSATFGPFLDLDNLYDQEVTITITAADAAGNTSSVPLIIRVLGRSCIG